MLQEITTATLTTFDSEQLNATTSNFGDFENVQLSGGPFRGQLMASDFGDSGLDMVLFSQDVLVRGSYPPDRITLAFVTSAREAGYVNGIRFGENDIMVVGEGAAMDAYRQPAGTHLVGFQTCPSRLEREGIAIPERSQIMIHSRVSPETLQLGRYLEALVTRLRGPRITSAQCAPGDGLLAEDDLIAGFRRAIDASQDQRLCAHHHSYRNRQRTLRKFEEVIEYHLSRDLRIPDLSVHVGIGQRTLEYFCNDFYGVSPRRYLTVRRLNSVRDCLLTGMADGESIAGIAARFGFRHAGRFSQAYRSLFGELPSKTLASRDA
ncbi:MAG: helix-turn-helix domain-containing protein [Gammaproteobacteria bacterium]|nr:helix-turn-helix domain-containing protein [Gammaproteobacteria bacterium]